MFGIGATYRKEMDATHAPMFGQIEGLYIDTIEKGVNLSDMLATMRTFASKYFEKDDDRPFLLYNKNRLRLRSVKE